MLVKDVMTPDPVTVQADAKVSEAASILRKRRIGGIPVMDGERLAGIVTETDLLSLLDVGELSDDLWLPSPLEIIEIPIREFVNWEKTRKALTDISESPISDIMSTDVIYIDENAEIEEAAKLMLSEGIARLPVVKSDRLVGIVTRQDIVRGIGTAFPEGTED
ncbi:putative signal transduction protein with CBS domains [Methanolacinia petrolearia DSM 11571]|uniref:Putative signal transduction protein with CBS domains n=1 Tax=Methanolacinia petrolearia (strain DSM 11571 / OCM 486 / SEBR 4847) TaxID=679926 RepID=E1RFP7_METP4|nr:CBS domain-containing protein [Methanolacinia petrolearia]ADN37351.1 putative signal transduction protein with CBS domains [Methanolacinia petrolearia DSM 11571]